MPKKAARKLIHLVCDVCGEQNYVTEVHRDYKDKLELMKYCPRCNTHTLHKEEKIK